MAKVDKVFPLEEQFWVGSGAVPGTDLKGDAVPLLVRSMSVIAIFQQLASLSFRLKVGPWDKMSI
jgi:hypothetical protein